jgi:hypothetical protein
MGLHVLGDWDSPVMPIMVYHIGLLATLSRLLMQRHIAMVVVGFPATPLLLCRCRVCISASHTREDLDYALDCIRDLVQAAGLDYANRSQGLRGLWQRVVRRVRGGGGGCGGGGKLVAGPKGAAFEPLSVGALGSRRTSSSGGSSCGADSGSGGSSTESSSCGGSAAGSRPGSAADSWGASPTGSAAAGHACLIKAA